MRRFDTRALFFRVAGSAWWVSCAACAWIAGAEDLRYVPDASAGTPDASGGTPADGGSEAGIGAEPDSGPALPDASSPLSISRVQVLAPGWSEVASLSIHVTETSGNLLVAGAYGVNSGLSFSVSDSLGNAWKSTAPQVNLSSGCNASSGANGTLVQIFYAQSIAGGQNVVKVSQSSNLGLGAFLVEYAGAQAPNAFDNASGAIAESSSLTMNAGPLATTGGRDMVVALFGDSQVGAGTMTPGPAFTGTVDKSFYSLIEDDLPSGAGPGTTLPTAMQPTVGKPNCWAATSAAFEAAVK